MAQEMMSRTLSATGIVATLEELEARIRDRFPERGLTKVCGELVAVARETAARVERSRRPNHLLRIAALCVLALAAFGFWAVLSEARLDNMGLDEVAGASAIDLAQAFESLVNLVILVGVAVWFLFSLEVRISRGRALDHLHELRSLAHIVDMHQLTKDPVSILNPSLRLPTSPVRDLSPGELARYLDYCVEMLSLIGKLAALYAEHNQDAQIIEASNDIESLTTNLSRKIWQKIMMTGPIASPLERA